MKPFLNLSLIVVITCIFSLCCGCTEINGGGENFVDPGSTCCISVIDPSDPEPVSLFDDQGVLTEFFSPKVINKLGLSMETGFSIAYVEIGPGNGTPPHYLLGSGEVIYVISGEAEATVDGVKHTLEEGRAIFIPAGSVQSVINTGEGKLKYTSSVQPYYKYENDILIKGDIGNLSYKSHPEILISNPEENERWDPSAGCEIYAVMNPGMLKLSENEILPVYSIAYAEFQPGASIPSQVLTGSNEIDYLIEGQIDIRSGEFVYTITEGQAVLIPKGVAREFENSGDGRAVLLSYVDPYWKEETAQWAE
ncbi:MAG: cupin domain-containing protein [Methanomicrobiaceae archaeon]|nr:cupin domain-containing protein [Methanomicrobiaceae archaeon]